MDPPSNNLVEESQDHWPDGVPFYSKRWSPPPSQKPRALLICLHGFAEHIGRYDAVMPSLAERGIEVYGFDQRGFGKSGPEAHGDTSLVQALGDLQSVFTQERERLSVGGSGQTPIFLYGHSMGATTILAFLTRPEQEGGAPPAVKSQIAGVVLSAPWILRTKPPSRLVLALAPWLVWLYPNMPFNKAINPHHLSSDPGAAKSYTDDPLHDGNVYLKTLVDPLLAGYRLMAEGYKYWPSHVPILVNHGEDDPSTSSVASRHFVEKLGAGDKEFKAWPGMLHEGHNERPEIRDPFIEHIIQWIETRSPIEAASSKL